MPNNGYRGGLRSAQPTVGGHGVGKPTAFSFFYSSSGSRKMYWPDFSSFNMPGNFRIWASSTRSMKVR